HAPPSGGREDGDAAGGLGLAEDRPVDVVERDGRTSGGTGQRRAPGRQMVHGSSEVWPYVFALDRLLRLIAVPVHISSTDGVRRCDRHDGTGRSAPGGAAPLGGTR